MFDKMKALMEMQKKIQEMKQELENTIFEIDSSDGLVKIRMNGSQDLKDIVIKADPKELEKATLEKALKDAYNRAIKHSHELAAQKMKAVGGGNLPGL